MRPLEIGVVYVIVGVAVAVALHRGHLAGVVWAPVLWPLFLPGLLVTRSPAAPAADRRIPEAIAGLRAALDGGLPPGVDTSAALAAARRGLDALAARQAELDRLLAMPSNDLDRLEADRSRAGAGSAFDARIASVRVLARLRDEAHADLERGLVGIDDLGTRAQIARFGGGGADLEAQLAALAAAVDGVAEVRRLGAGKTLFAPSR